MYELWGKYYGGDWAKINSFNNRNYALGQLAEYRKNAEHRDIEYQLREVKMDDDQGLIGTPVPKVDWRDLREGDRVTVTDVKRGNTLRATVEKAGNGLYTDKLAIYFSNYLALVLSGYECSGLEFSDLERKPEWKVTYADGESHTDTATDIHEFIKNNTLDRTDIVSIVKL